MKSVGWLCAAACLTLAGGAGAAETGLELGLRSGYALPLGNILSDNELRGVAKGIVPLWFDLGYRVTPNVMVGAYFQYGFGVVGENCDEGHECSLHNVRLGAQVHYHFMPWEKVDPWLGAGIGYEWLTGSESRPGTVMGVPQTVEASTTIHGFEFVNFQGGLDFLPAEGTNFGLGPFVALTLAQFSKYSTETASGERSGDVEDASLHQWLTLGVRGTVVF